MRNLELHQTAFSSGRYIFYTVVCSAHFGWVIASFYSTMTPCKFTFWHLWIHLFVEFLQARPYPLLLAAHLTKYKIAVFLFSGKKILSAVGMICGVLLCPLNFGMERFVNIQLVVRSTKPPQWKTEACCVPGDIPPTRLLVQTKI